MKAIHQAVGMLTLLSCCGCDRSGLTIGSVNPSFKNAPPAKIYTAQRHPQHGSKNPEAMDFLFWLWMVESEISPYEAAQHYGAPGAMEAGPGWTFMRMGMSETRLPDGRVIFIAGEHEDH
jgi:hypothetical protein